MMNCLVPMNLMVLGPQEPEHGAQIHSIQHGQHKAFSATVCLEQNLVAQAHLHPQRIPVLIWTHSRYQTQGKFYILDSKDISCTLSRMK